MNFNELVEHSLGTKMRIVNDIANIVLCCGLLIAYQYIISTLSLQVLNYFFGIDCEGYPKLIQIIVAAVILQIPLSLFKKISDLQYISIIGSFSIIITVLVIIVESPFYFIQAVNNDEPMPVLPPKGIGLGFVDTIGMFLYGFSSHNGIFQTFNELNRPGKRRCHKVLNRAFLLELIIYLPLALAGFFSTFYNTPDVFLRRPNLNGFNDVIIIIVRIFLIFTMSSSIAVNYNILRMSINSMFFTEKPSTPVDSLIVVLVYIITNVITYFLKNAGTLLSFLGGLSTVMICFITPICIDIVVKPELKSKQRRYFNYAFMVLIIMTSIACTGKGVYDFILSDDEKPLCPS